MTYVVQRVATQNDAIAGRTLYLTIMGFWTLDADRALTFDSAAKAANHGPFPNGTEIKRRAS